MNNIFDNILWYLLLGAIFIWYFFSEMIVTIPYEQTDDDLIKGVIEFQSEQTKAYLREELGEDIFSDKEINDIAICSDNKIIDFINSFPDTYKITTPEFSSQDELNGHVENIIKRKVEGVGYGIDRMMQIATSSCIDEIKQY